MFQNYLFFLFCTYILKVNINCQGCKTKVKKTLRKIQGVYSVDIDTDQQAVIIRGNLDPEILVKKLNRRGKHAEILLIIPNHKDQSCLNHHDNNNNNISSRNTTHYHFNNVPSYERTNLLNQQSDEEKMMMNMNMKPVMMNDADYFHMNNQSENFQELFGEIPRRNNYEEANPNVMKDMDIGYANAYSATETMNMSIGRGPSLVPQAMNQEQFNSKQLHRSYY
ncbi:unnamed protein product [Cochlearia groenlandica]